MQNSNKLTLEKFYKFIKDEDLIPETTTSILIGLSGGVDSVILIDLLAKYKEKYRKDITILCHHQHHMIRTNEADRDLAFSEALAKSYSFEFYYSIDNVPKLTKQNKGNLEAIAREVRYKNWLKIRDKLLMDGEEVCIALAHHASDQAETVLQRLSYGTSIVGLAGIRAKQSCFIRPLLFAQKGEIYDYAREHDLKWVEDSSNDDSSYQRNFFRNQLLPLWQANEQKNVIQNISNTAKSLQDISSYLEDLFSEFESKSRYKQDDFFVLKNYKYYDIEILRTMDTRLLDLYLVYLLKNNDVSKDYSSVLIFSIRDLLLNDGGEKRLSLPNNRIIFKNNRYFFFAESSLDFTRELNMKNRINDSISLDKILDFNSDKILNSEFLLSVSQFETSDSKTDEMIFLENNRLGMILSTETIKKMIIGPYDGQKRTYFDNLKLKDYMSFKGIPTEIRQHVPVFYLEGKALAIATHIVSKDETVKQYKVEKMKNNSTEFLQIICYNSKDIL